MPGVGPTLTLSRRYSNESAATESAFGYGWDFSLNYRLQICVGYHITEHRGDGGRTTFTFTDGTVGRSLSADSPDGMRYTYRGYYAPWSATQEKQSGRVTRYTDLRGVFSMAMPTMQRVG